MARKGTLTVRLIGDSRKLEQTLKGAGSKVGQFAKVAVLAGGAAAAAFGVKAVKGAVELNETLSKTEQVFKDASDDVVSFADEMGAAFGLPKQEILDAASNIGLVAKASGLSEQAAADMSTEMAQLAADASSFFNVPLPEALEKIRSGLVGEAEPLRAFGVLLSAAAVEEKALALGIAEAGEELTEQQKVMARSAIITEQMSDASGDLERTSDSLANRWRALQGRAENFAAEVGQKLIPVITTVWDWLDQKLPPAFEAVGAVIQTNVVPAFQALRGWWDSNGPAITAAITDVAQTVVTWWQDTAQPAIVGFGGAVQRFWQQTVKPILAELQQTWEENGDTIGRIVGDLVEAVRSLGSAVGQVFAQGNRDVQNNTGSISDTLGRLINTIETVTTVVSDVAAAFDRYIGPVVRASRAVNEFMSPLQQIRNAMDSARDAVDGLRDAFNNLPASTRGVFSGLWESFRSVYNRIVSGWNSLSFSLPGARVPGFGSVGGFTLSTPNLPRLEDGGEVLKTGVAVVHRGERFSGTRNQFPIGGGGDTYITLHAPNYVGDKQDLLEMMKSLLAQDSRRGGTLVANVAAQ